MALAARLGVSSRPSRDVLAELAEDRGVILFQGHEATCGSLRKEQGYGGWQPPANSMTVRLLVATFHHGSLEHHIHRARAAMLRLAGGETQDLGALTEPGVDVALDHRA